MVRAREVSPVELVRAHLDQIAAQRERINAFASVLEDEALEAARLAEDAVARGEPRGILNGVPLTVKDTFDLEGRPTLAGSRLRAGHRAAQDATAAARLKAEGAILLGKTNCPEFASSYETDNYVTGRTNNPWNPERTPGGSSGGEAAAIAAFCSAGGVGSDAGGSIRVPAHFCGICGLKPTPGRVSIAGHVPAAAHPASLFAAAGPMARSVRDVRLLFAALAGYDHRDPLSAPVPLRPPGAVSRIGIMEQFGRAPVDPEIREAVLAAGRMLEMLGYIVEPFETRGLERAPNLWAFFHGPLLTPFLRRMIEGRESDAHWTLTENLQAAGLQPGAAEVVENLAARDAMRAALLRRMEQTPLMLMPPCGITAFPHRARRFAIGAAEIGLFQAMMPATPWNLLGLPALVLPFALSAERLPIGVQIVGRPWEEETLLEIGVRLGEARGPIQ
ncbi:MAG: amidase [Bryobacteraceae bacterium]